MIFCLYLVLETFLQLIFHYVIDSMTFVFRNMLEYTNRIIGQVLFYTTKTFFDN